MGSGAAPTMAADLASLGEDRSTGWDGAAGWAHLWGQPPRWLFHLAAVFPVAVLLWDASLPGATFALSVLAVFALGSLVLLWLARVIAFALAPVRRPRSLPWLLVAPIGAIALVALLVADVPLSVRWAQSRSAFDEVVATSEAPGADELLVLPGFPRRVGTYDITSATRQGDAVAFFEEHGAFLDQAGFVHLPDGTRRGDVLSGFSQLESLGGDWYTFTLHN